MKCHGWIINSYSWVVYLRCFFLLNTVSTDNCIMELCLRWQIRLGLGSVWRHLQENLETWWIREKNLWANYVFWAGFSISGSISWRLLSCSCSREDSFPGKEYWCYHTPWNSCSLYFQSVSWFLWEVYEDQYLSDLTLEDDMKQVLRVDFQQWC